MYDRRRMTTALIKYDDQDDKRPSTSDLVASFLRRRKKQTLKTYKTDLDSFRTWYGAETPEGAIDGLISMGRASAHMKVQAWQTDLSELGYAPATINRKISSLRSLMKLAFRSGLVKWVLDDVDMIAAKPYRDTRGPGEDGFVRILDVVDNWEDTDYTRRDKAILHLLFGLGLRRAEVAKLDVEHVDFDSNELTILGKAREETEQMTMTPLVVEVLKSWLERRGESSGALFLGLDPAGKGDGRITGSSIHRLVKRAAKQAGLDTHPHALRHSAITAVLDATNGDVRKAQRFSRHKRLDTLVIYDDNREDLGGQAANLLAKRLEERRRKKRDTKDGPS